MSYRTPTRLAILWLLAMGVATSPAQAAPKDPNAAATLSIGGSESIGYSDNLYRSDTLKEGDFFSRFMPEFVISTDLKPYDLQVKGRLDMGRFASESQNNYQDADLAARGSYDLSTHRQVYLDGRVRYDHVAIGAFADDPDILAAEPSTYRFVEGGSGLTHQDERWFWSLDGRAYQYNYDNVDRRNATRLINDDRDHTALIGTGRLGIRPWIGSENPLFFLQLQGNWQDYLREIDASLGQRKDSSGHTLLGGIAYGAPDDAFSLDAGLGILSQHYDSAALPDIQTWAAQSQLQWRFASESRLRSEFTRRIHEATLRDTSAYVLTQGRVRVDTMADADWRIGGGLRYSQLDFQINPLSGRAARIDHLWDGSLFADYLLTPDYSLGLEYIHALRRSDQPVFDFNGNTLLLRFGVKY